MSVIAQPGVWTWFADPRAIEVDGVTYLGWHEDDGIWIGRHDGQTWQTFRLLGTSPDDHNVVSIAVRPDGRLLACYSAHNGPMYSRVSTNPGDVTAWGAEATVDAGACTYANLQGLSSTWYLFYRRLDTPGTYPHYMVTSTDGGQTWSAPTLMLNLTGERPYVKIDGDGTRIDFLTTDGHPDHILNQVYHFSFDGTTWRDSADADIGPLPLAPSDGTEVYTGGDNAWTWDIATSGTMPVAVFATFPGSPDIDDHRYHYARWDGSVWQSAQIATAGRRITHPTTQPYYSGGIALDHADPSTAYLSRQVGDGWQIQRWTTSDSGTSWHVTPVSDSTVKHIRPVVVRGSTRVLWNAGRYDDYIDFDTVILADPPLTLPDAEAPAEEPAAPASVRATIEWIACDLVTGDKLAYLPATKGPISRALGTYTSDTLTVPAPLYGQYAMGGLLPYAIGPDELPTRMMVCIINDIPAWAGIIWKVRAGSDAVVELGCATAESYLDRRYIDDVQFSQTDQAGIARALIDAVNVEGIGLAVDCPDTGILRDRTYWDDEDATFYQRLTELMDVENGLEWTIDPMWRDSRQQSVKLVFRGGLRIGSAIPKGPLSTESAAVTSYSISYDYAKGAGANDVIAYSSGEGEDRPESVHIRNELALASGVPRVEHRWSPSSSIKDVAVLNAHAHAALTRLDAGTTSITVDARWDMAPARLGVDLLLGDTIEYRLTGHAHPAGLLGTARIVGWRLDTAGGTFQPVLRM